MDKVLKFFLGNHQSSSLVGYAIGLFALFNDARESGAVSTRDAVIVAAIVFGFRFLNENVPSIGGVVSRLLNVSGDGSGQALPPVSERMVQAVQTSPGLITNTQSEQVTRLQQQLQAAIGQRDAVIKDAALMREQLRQSDQQLGVLRAELQSQVAAIRDQSDGDLLRHG